MPKWIHNRADHIRAKNPSMPESEAFAIATQQAHATGESPKGYGTSKGRHEAKEKYKTPSDDKKTADPGGIGKRMEKDAFIFRAIAPAIVKENDDRMRQIIREELQAANQPAKPDHPHHPQQPSLKAKEASLVEAPFSLALIGGFSDELQKIAGVPRNLPFAAHESAEGAKPSTRRWDYPEHRMNAHSQGKAIAEMMAGPHPLNPRAAELVDIVRGGAHRSREFARKSISKIAQMTMNSVAPKPTVSSQVTSRVPRNTMSTKMPTYSQMNPASTPGPAQSHQPTLEPPPVRG